MASLNFADVFSFDVTSLTIGQENNKYFLDFSGKLEIIAQPANISSLLPDKVPIEGMRIWEDGKLEFEGGTIILNESMTLNAGPVNFGVTAIHFGSTEQKDDSGTLRQYSYFGFDGNLGVNPGGVDARGNGVKYYFSTDHVDSSLNFDHFLRIDGIGIDIRIPGDKKPADAQVILQGFLSMANPQSTGSQAGDPSTEYIGSVNLALPKAKIAGGAGMRLNPDAPYFIVDMNLELPKPIPLANTGLGIYGFRGMLGKQYLPSKPAASISQDDPWWQYYKQKTPPPNEEGVNIYKFGQDDGFTAGAGVSIATTADSGKTFSSKIFLMLGLPDVFLLIGKGAVLSERIGLDNSNDPPFSVLLAISNDSVEAGFGVNYKLPQNANKPIASLQGTINMAYFFNDATAWYVNIGQETPKEKRLQARLLDIFSGYAFLMINYHRFKIGAGAGYKLEKSFGPVGVSLGAYIDKRGFISFDPVEMGGSIQLGGYAHLKVFKFKFGFEVGAGLAAEAPEPFKVSGYFFLKINTPWPFKDVKVKVTLEWVFNKNVRTTGLPALNLPAPNSPEPLPANAINIMSGQTFSITHHYGSNNSTIPAPNDSAWAGAFADHVVPLDSFIDIELQKPVLPENGTSNIGGKHLQVPKDFEITVPPKKGISDQVYHKLKLKSAKIYSYDYGTSQWKEYKVYDAVTAIKNLPNTDNNKLKNLPDGYWQFMEKNKFNKIRFLGDNVFSYTTQSSPGGLTIENYGYGRASIFCPEKTINKHCVNWDDEPLGKTYDYNQMYYKDGILFKFLDEEGYGEVSSQYSGNLYQALKFVKSNKLEIHFPEPTSIVDLTLEASANNYNVEVDYYKKSFQQYDLKATKTYQGNFPMLIQYNDINNPIDKIEVRHSGGGFPLNPANEGDLYIGTNTPFVSSRHFLQGFISDVKFYDRALTEQEVIDSHQDPYLTFSNISAWWDFDGDLVENINGNNANFNGNTKLFGISNKNKMDGYLIFNSETQDYCNVPHSPTITFDRTSFSILARVFYSNIKNNTSQQAIQGEETQFTTPSLSKALAHYCG